MVYRFGFIRQNRVIFTTNKYFLLHLKIINSLKPYVLMLQLTIPQPMRKAELNELLKGFGRRLVAKEIIEVIKENRKVSEKEAKDTKTVYPNEVAAILSRFE